MLQQCLMIELSNCGPILPEVADSVTSTAFSGKILWCSKEIYRIICAGIGNVVAVLVRQFGFHSRGFCCSG